MNRGYSAGQYRDFIDRARGMMPDICIASDFIVGFPTETDDDFTASADILRYCRFKNSFIFKYSPRPGTTAIDRFADDVPEEIKRRRNSDLLAVQQTVSTENNREMIGKTVEVLVEGQSKLAAPPSYPAAGGVELGWERRADAATPGVVQLIGRTRGDQVVAFDGEESLAGELIDVEIVAARSLTLFGRVNIHAGAPAH
jgi:tRNA-2-methylthio-N6-dimethylallyladenosine synthase